ncbi:hypothetical protein A2W14_06195 [Candidatus Gottesmanbacteria bacterium RBG_16_37_8]|uniref:Signal peptidase I n=1 Tax=Candidatus Gottesmanbacteria bacterium RBG_16_37_8 TaxID=1798371 RepID=A0A1F5YVA7_9BACT|nr:MAG: hypothetical protein A2W14_06195 [Candidatus Gottesmanbacteria bacterium RBG_16_37_8]
MSVGSIIAFRSPVDSSKTIIHRISGEKSEAKTRIFYTKGDNNKAEDLWEVEEPQVLGRVIGAIPFLGNVSAAMRTPVGFGGLVVLPAAFLLLSNIRLVRRGIEEEIERRARRLVAGKSPGILLIFIFSAFSGALMAISGYKLAEAIFSSFSSLAGISFATKDYVAPPAPVLLLPLNNSYRNTAGMVMDWSDVSDFENMSPAVYYIYQSARNSGFSPLAYQSGNLSVSQIPAPGTPDGIYWWRVKACDTLDNCSGWSSVFKMTIDSTAPSMPSWVTPADNSYTNQSQNILLDWSNSTDANLAGYEYENTGPGGTWKSVDYCGLLTTSQIPNSQIGPGGTCINAPAATLSVDGVYLRMVRAVDLAGNKSVWSATFKLTRDTVNPTSVFSTPSSGVEYAGVPITIGGTSTDNYTIDSVSLYYSDYTSSCSASYSLITTLDNALNNTPYNFSYLWTPPSSGSYCIKARATDLAGNIEASPVIENVDYYKAPTLEAKRSADSHNVIVDLSGLSPYQSYSYRVTYKHDGIDEAYSGSVTLSGEDTSSRSFVLGSCSGEACVYFEGISDLTVNIDVYTPGGSVYHLSQAL